MKTPDAIALVDDNLEEIDTIRRLLERGGLGPIEVFDPKEFSGVSDYSFLAVFGKFGAGLLDQRLDERTGVPYTGLQLATYLRVVRPELPIYILTNYAGDSSEHEEARDVEDVIAKSDFNRLPSKFIARILRAVARYEDALSTKSKELEELIDKKLSNHLDDADAKRLVDLRNEFERTTAGFNGESDSSEEESEESKLLNQVLTKLRDLS